MRKSSIRTKITIIVVGFAILVVAISWLICNFLISGVFVWNIEKNLELTYQSCNSLVQEMGETTIENGELLGQIKNPIEAVVYIFDAENNRIFTSVNANSNMWKSLNYLMSTVKESLGDGSLKKGQYITRRYQDQLTNAEYFDLVGLLDNGYLIILRSPVSRVQTTMQVLNGIFVYIAAGVIVFGSVFILILSNVFSEPMKRLSRAAKRIANLDFEEEIPVTSHDEIGELSHYMNEMSHQLENTISELKSANIQLEKDIAEKEEIDEMRREFLSHVSHELKTPIALIQGYAEGLKDNINDDPESMEFYTDVIIDEAGKMNMLVKKLLALNEIEFGNTPLKVERFELTGFIREILSASKILSDDVNAQIEFDEKIPTYVWADEYMIEGVVTNYVTNAIHYVKPGGKIRIWYEPHDTDVRVNVYNEGDCISDEDINKLFIKFYKADKARTREYGGNGIGLSIVAATMNAHGKKYGVYNVDDGVVFYFDLDANMLADK